MDMRRMARDERQCHRNCAFGVRIGVCCVALALLASWPRTSWAGADGTAPPPSDGNAMRPLGGGSAAPPMKADEARDLYAQAVAGSVIGHRLRSEGGIFNGALSHAQGFDQVTQLIRSVRVA